MAYKLCLVMQSYLVFYALPCAAKYVQTSRLCRNSCDSLARKHYLLMERVDRSWFCHSAFGTQYERVLLAMCMAEAEHGNIIFLQK